MVNYAPPLLRRRSSLVRQDLSGISLGPHSTHVHNTLEKTEAGTLLVPEKIGLYNKLEIEVRTQKLTAEEEASDVDKCIEACMKEIDSIGRHIFKEYCELRVQPPKEIYCPFAAAMMICGETTVSWTFMKRWFAKGQYIVLKEQIRAFDFAMLTAELYEHVNDFVRRNWDSFNYVKVHICCEELAPISEWVKFILKKFDLHERIRCSEQRRASRRSVASRASLKRLSSINNFTVPDTMATISENGSIHGMLPEDQGVSPTHHQISLLRSATTIPVSMSRSAAASDAGSLASDMRSTQGDITPRDSRATTPAVSRKSSISHLLRGRDKTSTLSRHSSSVSDYKSPVYSVASEPPIVSPRIVSQYSLSRLREEHTAEKETAHTDGKKESRRHAYRLSASRDASLSLKLKGGSGDEKNDKETTTDADAAVIPRHHASASVKSSRRRSSKRSSGASYFDVYNIESTGAAD